MPKHANPVSDNGMTPQSLPPSVLNDWGAHTSKDKGVYLYPSL
jgi:hypothetical protein